MSAPFTIVPSAALATKQLLELRGIVFDDKLEEGLFEAEGYYNCVKPLIAHNEHQLRKIVVKEARKIDLTETPRDLLHMWCDAILANKHVDVLNMAKLVSASVVVVYVPALNGLNTLGAYAFINHLINNNITNIQLIVSDARAPSLIATHEQLFTILRALRLSEHINMIPIDLPTDSLDFHKLLLPQLLGDRLKSISLEEFDSDIAGNVARFLRRKANAEFVVLGTDNRFLKAQLPKGSGVMCADVQSQLSTELMVKFYGEDYKTNTKLQLFAFLIARISELGHQARLALNDSGSFKLNEIPAPAVK